MALKAKKLLSFLLLTALLLSAVGPVYAAESDTLDPEEYDLDALESGKHDWETDIQLLEDYEPDVIIIQLKDRSAFPDKEKQYDDAVAKILGTGFELITDNTYLVQVAELSKNPKAVLNRFKNNRFVEYVEPNYLASFELAPTDPNYKTIGTGFAKVINAEAGWDIITGSSVPVAVVDSGYSGSTDLPSASGYSIYNKSYDLTDKAGHGTQVAGTLGAVGNNGDKNVGVIWDANILPVKVTESMSVTAANVASGIIWAADNGARVINLSLSFSTGSTTVKNAVDYAYKKGCVIVAATGNDGKGSVGYPAAYTNVLGVGSTTNGSSRYSLSNYGNGLDVLASFSWYSTTIRNNNTISSGTSISSPQVSGLAALVWELAPSLTNAQVMQLIRDNTNRGDGSWDSQTGYGVIDMGKTLAAAQALGGGVPTEQPDTQAPVITLKGSAVIELTEGDTYVEPGYTAIDDKDGDVTHLVTVSGKVATAYTGEYTLTYTFYDKAGNTGTATRTVIVAPAPTQPEDEPVPPTITQIGSNPIILHLEGSPYVEQGARATDDVDGDLSSFVTIEGDVDTSNAGTYHVVYSVTNSAGLSASVTREVRVLEPKVTLERTPYSFSGQGKEGASDTYYVDAAADGIMELTASGLSKATVLVTVTDSTGSQVFSQAFAGNETVEFWVAEGSCTIDATIISGKGNTKYSLSLLTPEVMYATFTEEEIPLEEKPNLTTAYTVLPGDNLTRIAIKLYGDGSRWREIYDRNREVIGSNPNLIYAGQVLTVKVK